MQRYCESHGAHFVVLHWRFSPRERSNLLGNAGLDVIDTLQDAPDGWEAMHAADGHPDARAGEHVAQLLWRELAARGWLAGFPDDVSPTTPPARTSAARSRW
jgi:hypothetical protein